VEIAIPMNRLFLPISALSAAAIGPLPPPTGFQSTSADLR